MSIDAAFQGSLFANDFLCESIVDAPDWQTLDDAALDDLEAGLRAIFDGFPFAGAPNESQTEDDLIWLVLARLGWTASLRQQNLSAVGREDVPDGLLFADEAVKGRANALAHEWRRYEHGLAVVESKRWKRPLDRRSGRAGEETAPSTQMLRYLRRVDDLTTGALRWGILTKGARWRLYYQGARSVSEQFFEVDLPAILDLPGHNDGLFALDDAERRHCLTLFALVFRREAFLPDTADERTFHQRAIEEGRFYEERVAANLSKLVFGQVFPELARAIAAAAPEATLAEVREAALILLYRLLFILYAEDRDLLPVRDERYDDYGLRDKVRGDIGSRKDRGDVFSEHAARYWSAVDDLCLAVDRGDATIGLPPYDGGLFDRARVPLLDRIRLGDRVMADVIDALSFEQDETGRRRYINYRDLGVRQLGSIYERLLEHELVRNGDAVAVRPNIFARKGSGSYYTPDDLVALIVEETIGPLVQARTGGFMERAARVPAGGAARERAVMGLAEHDPAEAILALRVCDPAMGSGHFLVTLVDYLADRVIGAMAEAEAAVEGYVSPLVSRIQAIRARIVANAEELNWTIDRDRLDDRHIVRRMVLKRCVYGVEKRCVYGVDKNPMAVELAKVALWLHTFTVGAPLSFLDHHLRCGDSLFGAWARSGIDKATEYGSPLLLHGSVTEAERAAQSMQTIEGLTDAEIAEAHRSAEAFAEVEKATAPLNAVLSLVHALDWLAVKDREGRTALQSFFGGLLGDPIEIALGRAEVSMQRPESKRFLELLQKAQGLVREERFLNWQTAFPGVWTNWQSLNIQGGFDAVIGNPPWDRVKLQQVEWFSTRRREIALQPRAADRKRMIAALKRDGDPLAQDYALASERAAAAARMARDGGNYPLLSSRDVNLYSLFVERAMALVKPQGMVGLLTPIGIATDMSASQFFSTLVEKQLIRIFYAFENRRGWLFPDIHHEEQPSIVVFSNGGNPFSSIRLCVRISGWEQFHDSERRFSVDSTRITRINPNTGTVPLFRTRRDAELITAIYERLPILVDRSSDDVVKAWPVKYFTMFHMTKHSALFHTREELEEHEGAYPVGGNRYNSPHGLWTPLYEGKTIQLFNHRYASVRVNTDSISGQGFTDPLTHDMLRDPSIIPEPRYWVRDEKIPSLGRGWAIGFNDICNTNNARSLISAIVPVMAFGNTLPIFLPIGDSDSQRVELLAGNLGAIICDYIARQKIQARHLNKYIIEQLPVVPPDRYEAVRFGPKTASEIIREAVLELTYTAHDMAPFALDMGHVDAAGNVLPPFAWDEERRLRLRAKLDAVFFHLYGVTDRDDVRYVYSTFPIVEREETTAYGTYRSRDLCLAWMNALAAGDPDAEIVL